MAQPIELYDQVGVTINESDISNITQVALPAGQTIVTGVQTYNPAFYVAVDTVDNAIKRTGYQGAPIDPSTFDRVNGAVLQEDATLTVNVTEGSQIFYGEHLKACIRLVRCKKVTVNVSGLKHAGYGIYLNGCEDVEIIAEGDQLGHGVFVSGSSGIHVHHSRFTRAAMAGLQCFGHCDDVMFEFNEIDAPCQAECTGGIYGGTTSGWKRARFNRITNVPYGRYWPQDGSGLFADNWGSGWDFRFNVVAGCEQLGAQDNSGLGGNTFVNNAFIRCPLAFKQTNSREIDVVNAVTYRNNVLIDSPEGWKKETPTGPELDFPADQNYTGSAPAAVYIGGYYAP